MNPAAIQGIQPGPEARDIEQARLRPLFAPRAIAVIGASRDPAKLGAAMTRSLAGFPGTVVGINPRDADPPAGRYRTVAVPPLAPDTTSALGELLPPLTYQANRDEAHKALAELPGPVAVKILDAGLSHKSDIGGVHLGVRDPAGLDAALDALDRIGARRYLVETMAPPGLDLIAGAARDPVFGPTVLVGLGGTIAEALADVAVAPAPLTPVQAGALTGELAGRALLDGFRGGPAADRGAIGAILAALGDLLVAHPVLEAAEINPLRVTGEGLLALDAVVTRRDQEAEHRA